MKRNFFVGLIVLALVIVATATGASSDQGRRLAGPFCVGKAGLQPVWAKNEGGKFVKLTRAGVVRSVSFGEKCQSDEIPKVGVAIPDNDPTAPQAPTAPGAKGEKGDKGDTGATGAAGAKGDTGAQGATGATGPAGPAGKDGKDGTVTGTIPVCASNGGNLKLCGGDNGHDPVGYLVLTGGQS
jgi:hypothetical protein